MDRKMLEKLNMIVGGAVGRKVEFDESAHLTNDEILDSLDSSVYLLEIERDFNVKLDDETVENHDLFLVSNMIDFLSKSSE
jgi:acyl carrier protein